MQCLDATGRNYAGGIESWVSKESSGVVTITSGTMDRTLKKLLDEGTKYIVEDGREPRLGIEGIGGRPRIYYKLTADGKTVLRELREGVRQLFAF